MADFVRRKCKRSAPMESSTTSSVTKKLRIHFRNDYDSDNFNPSFDFDLPPQPPRLFAVSPTTSSNTGDANFFSANSPDYSCCSSNESSEILKDCFRFVDLEVRSFETESSLTCINKGKLFCREDTPSSEFCGDTDGMDSTAAKNFARKSPVGNMPSQAEIEEFFSAAEKKDQKRFSEKYNYDVVKDAPLEGRYQWVSLKP